MTKLQKLYAEQGQSPWLDNLTTRRHLREGLPRTWPFGRALEDEGVTSFAKSFDDLIRTLEDKRSALVSS